MSLKYEPEDSMSLHTSRIDMFEAKLLRQQEKIQSLEAQLAEAHTQRDIALQDLAEEAKSVNKLEQVILEMSEALEKIRNHHGLSADYNIKYNRLKSEAGAELFKHATLIAELRGK